MCKNTIYRKGTPPKKKTGVDDRRFSSVLYEGISLPTASNLTEQCVCPVQPRPSFQSSSGHSSSDQFSLIRFNSVCFTWKWLNTADSKLSLTAVCGGKCVRSVCVWCVCVCVCVWERERERERRQHLLHLLCSQWLEVRHHLHHLQGDRKVGFIACDEETEGRTRLRCVSFFFPLNPRCDQAAVIWNSPGGCLLLRNTGKKDVSCNASAKQKCISENPKWLFISMRSFFTHWKLMSAYFA